jgi:hypothetical protein
MLKNVIYVLLVLTRSKKTLRVRFARGACKRRNFELARRRALETRRAEKGQRWSMKMRAINKEF